MFDLATWMCWLFILMTICTVATTFLVTRCAEILSVLNNLSNEFNNVTLPVLGACVPPGWYDALLKVALHTDFGEVMFPEQHDAGCCLKRGTFVTVSSAIRIRVRIIDTYSSYMCHCTLHHGGYRHDSLFSFLYLHYTLSPHRILVTQLLFPWPMSVKLFREYPQDPNYSGWIYNLHND